VKSLIIFATFILVIIFEVGWFLYPRAGSLGRDDYRFNERRNAYMAYAQTRSTSDWNKVREELELDAKHDSNRRIAELSIILALDIPIFVLILRSLQSHRKSKKVPA
jgi:hypothetical protein